MYILREEGRQCCLWQSASSSVENGHPSSCHGDAPVCLNEGGGVPQWHPFHCLHFLTLLVTVSARSEVALGHAGL